jgi:hypothetical protein
VQLIVVKLNVHERLVFELTVVELLVVELIIFELLVVELITFKLSLVELSIVELIVVGLSVFELIVGELIAVEHNVVELICVELRYIMPPKPPILKVVLRWGGASQGPFPWLKPPIVLPTNCCTRHLSNRVARFFLVHDTKTGKIYQMDTKCTK